MEVPKLFNTEINASKCFVITLIENCQNDWELEIKWITVVVDRWWWKAGMSGGRGESGGRGRDGGAVVKERWQRKRRLWPWIQTYFHYLSVWTRMKTTVDWPVF
ncbi:unnamed protein product [Brassica oleracea]